MKLKTLLCRLEHTSNKKGGGYDSAYLDWNRQDVEVRGGQLQINLLLLVYTGGSLMDPNPSIALSSIRI